MFAEKNTFYDTLVAQAEALIADETDLIANMANVSALLFLEMPNLNWAGFCNLSIVNWIRVLTSIANPRRFNAWVKDSVSCSIAASL